MAQELEKLTESVDFLIFPADLNAAERKHAHEAKWESGVPRKRKFEAFGHQAGFSGNPQVSRW